MADGNATTVGSIVGKLKIDSSEWHRELAQAETKANQLGRANPKIKVETTGTAQAVTALTAVAAAEDKVSASSQALARMRAQGRAVTAAQAITEREAVKPIMSFTEWTQRSAQATDTDTEAKERNASANRRVDSTAKQAGGSIHLLYSSLAMLAPAVVPLAGFAVAGAGALAMMGAAGVLAVKGISDEIKEGGPLANQYGEGIAALKTQFNGLANTSAVNMLSGFNQSVAILDAYMPSLNRQTAQYSLLLGDMGSNTLAGLLGSFRTLNPVFQSFTTYLHGLTQGLEGIGSSDGMRRFGDYALATMPMVISTVESLVSGVSALLVALAPLGGVALASLKVIGDTLDGLPTEVLTVLVGGALGAYAAFSTWSALIPLIQSFGLMLNVSLGPIGLVVAGVGALAGMMIGAAASTDKATGATIGYTSALERDSGAIGDNVRAHAAQEIAKSKAAGAADRLGVSLGLVTDAALGNKEAQAHLTAELDRLDAKAKDATGTTQEMGGINLDLVRSNQEVQASVATVREELTNQNSTLNASVEQQRRFQEAMADSSAGASRKSTELSILAGMYGTNVAALSGATQAERETEQQLAATTLQMQLQNAAGDLLKMQLDLLAGKSLSFEQAQNSFEKQLMSSTAALQQNGATLDGNSAAAVSNRGNLLQLVDSAQQTAEAFGTMTGSSEDARQKLIQQRQTIIDNAVANGMNRDAVTAYINKVMQIPSSVPPTKIQVDTAKAEADLAYLARHRTATITAITNQVKGSGYGDDPSMAALDPATHASGGMVNYLANGGYAKFIPSGTDTVPAMLTPGEIVMKKSSVDSIGAGTLLEANRTGQLPGGNITVHLVLDGKIIDTRIVNQLDHVSRQVGGKRR